MNHHAVHPSAVCVHQRETLAARDIYYTQLACTTITITIIITTIIIILF
jgi:hypothetical protein